MTCPNLQGHHKKPLTHFYVSSIASNTIGLFLLRAFGALDQSLDLGARKLTSGHPVLEQDVELGVRAALCFGCLGLGPKCQQESRTATCTERRQRREEKKGEIGYRGKKDNSRSRKNIQAVKMALVPAQKKAVLGPQFHSAGLSWRYETTLMKAMLMAL